MLYFIDYFMFFQKKSFPFKLGFMVFELIKKHTECHQQYNKLVRITKCGVCGSSDNYPTSSSFFFLNFYF